MKKKAKIVMDQISGIFLPVINIITGASILKCVLALLVSAGICTTDSGVYQILFAMADGFFYFLPMFLAITAAKQWKVDPFLAMLIPAAMLYPDIVAVLEHDQSISLAGLTVPPTIYHSSVIPVVLAVGLLVFVERFCKKVIPEIVRGFLTPIICGIVVLPFTFLLFGPLGTWIGNGLTRAFRVIYDWSAVAAGAFMGFVIQPMVSVGAHWSIVPVAIGSIMKDGYDIIMPLVGGAVYGQAGAAFAVGLLYKNNKEKRAVAFQSAFTAVLGVTEPALYSVNLPLMRPMIAGCFAGAISGGITGMAGTHCVSFAFPSFVTAVAFIGPGFVTFLLSMVLGFILGFVFTMLQKNKIKL